MKFGSSYIQVHEGIPAADSAIDRVTVDVPALRLQIAELVRIYADLKWTTVALREGLGNLTTEFAELSENVKTYQEFNTQRFMVFSAKQDALDDQMHKDIERRFGIFGDAIAEDINEAKAEIENRFKAAEDGQHAARVALETAIAMSAEKSVARMSKVLIENLEVVLRQHDLAAVAVLDRQAQDKAEMLAVVAASRGFIRKWVDQFTAWRKRKQTEGQGT